MLNVSESTSWNSVRLTCSFHSNHKFMIHEKEPDFMSLFPGNYCTDSDCTWHQNKVAAPVTLNIVCFSANDTPTPFTFIFTKLWSLVQCSWFSPPNHHHHHCRRLLLLLLLLPHYFHSPWWKEAWTEKQSRVQHLKPLGHIRFKYRSHTVNSTQPRGWRTWGGGAFSRVKGHTGRLI